jgi:hypothetical protein
MPENQSVAVIIAKPLDKEPNYCWLGGYKTEKDAKKRRRLRLNRRRREFFKPKAGPWPGRREVTVNKYVIVRLLFWGA